jgi:hypothetical protein
MKTRLRPYLITVLSILLASAALFVFLYTTADHDARENLKAEAMTVLMQLVAIGIIGGLVTWALNERSKEKGPVGAETGEGERTESAETGCA